MEKLTDQVSCLIQFNYFKQKKKKEREGGCGVGGCEFLGAQVTMLLSIQIQ